MAGVLCHCRSIPPLLCFQTLVRHSGCNLLYRDASCPGGAVGDYKGLASLMHMFMTRLAVALGVLTKKVRSLGRWKVLRGSCCA